MFQRIRNHASYANVMATVAVFVAIGGTSYAAITLPRNSVGQQQLKSGAVGPKELKRGAVGARSIKNGAVGIRDISTATRKALAGTPGPQGPPGAPAAALRVALNSAGEPTAGSAVG